LTATTTGSASTSTSGSATTGSGTVPALLTDTSTAKSCPHPATGATDANHAVSGQNEYVTWKNPWVYFHSVLDSTECDSSDVGLTQLADDLRSESSTPALSYIAPSPCDDGSDTPCRPGAKAGLAQADAFLKTVVPEIEASPAYKDNGLILITFDEAPQSGPDWSTGSCCDQPTFPNLPTTSSTSTTATTGTSVGNTGTSTTATTDTVPGTTDTTPTTTPGVPTVTVTTTQTGTATTDCTATTGTTSSTTTGSDTTATVPTTATVTTTVTVPATTTTTDGGTSSSTTDSGTSSTATTTGCQPEIIGDPPGGGQVGLLLISPYVQPGGTDVIDTYNHFSLLASEEKLLGLSPLGYASDTALPTFNTSLFLSTKR
jgi:hypothetical protein